MPTKRRIICALSIVLLCGMDGRHAPPISLAAYCNGTDDVDDTDCIGTWIQAGSMPPFRSLYVPPGTYLFSRPSSLNSGAKIRCASGSLFRNNGGTGLFLEAAIAVHHVRIEGCSFDVTGSTTNYLTVIGVNQATTSSDIQIRDSRFFDSGIDGPMSSEQRQYILLLNCMNCRVEHNHLSHGGRIKVGRPGSHLVVRSNTVEWANDNAISVVDLENGVSSDIVVEDNEILNPKGVGIFFGADGQGQAAAELTSRNVRIEKNRIRGDWLTGCIVGTLPAQTKQVLVQSNRCEKTGTAGLYQAGIVIIRTNGEHPRAERIFLRENTIFSSAVIAPGDPAPLDYGGIYISGNHSDVRVERNTITNVGPRAMWFNGVDIVNARVRNNTLTGGSFDCAGTITGVVDGLSSACLP